MGKTQSGAVWLDPEKTSPYDFYQYWRNVEDADVIHCMKMLTFLPLEEIARYEALEGAELNAAKEVLAYELTALVHGKEEAEKAQTAARAIFSGNNALAQMSETILTQDLLTDGTVGILDLLVLCGLAPSKGEARRLIQQGGISVNGEKVTEIGFQLSEQALEGDGAVIRKGKKVHHRVKK